MGAAIRRDGGQGIYLATTILVALVVFYGFSHTVGDAFFGPKAYAPPLLYVHALVSTSWLFVMIGQSALIRTGNTRLHRKLGPWAAGLGALLFVIGVAVAILMRHLDIADRGATPGRIAFLAIPLINALCFGALLTAAIFWRRRPDAHRRLMILLAWQISGAAVARFPQLLPDSVGTLIGAPEGAWLPMVLPNGMILLTFLLDIALTRRVHPAYLLGLPAVVASEALATYLYIGRPAFWVSFAGLLVQ